MPDATDWFATLLRMPDVMTKNETQELSEEEWAVVYSAVEKAVGALVDFRKQEGAALEKKLAPGPGQRHPVPVGGHRHLDPRVRDVRQPARP